MREITTGRSNRFLVKTDGPDAPIGCDVLSLRYIGTRQKHEVMPDEGTRSRSVPNPNIQPGPKLNHTHTRIALSSH